MYFCKHQKIDKFHLLIIILPFSPNLLVQFQTHFDLFKMSSCPEIRHFHFCHLKQVDYFLLFLNNEFCKHHPFTSVLMTEADHFEGPFITWLRHWYFCVVDLRTILPVNILIRKIRGWLSFSQDFMLIAWLLYQLASYMYLWARILGKHTNINIIPPPVLKKGCILYMNLRLYTSSEEPEEGVRLIHGCALYAPNHGIAQIITWD